MPVKLMQLRWKSEIEVNKIGYIEKKIFLFKELGSIKMCNNLIVFDNVTVYYPGGRVQ
jgi:hypothetical protein